MLQVWSKFVQVNIPYQKAKYTVVDIKDFNHTISNFILQHFIEIKTVSYTW